MTNMQNSADSQRSQSRPGDSSETQQAVASSGDGTLCIPAHAATRQSATDSNHAFSQAVAAPDGNAPLPNEHQRFVTCCTGQQLHAYGAHAVLQQHAANEGMLDLGEKLHDYIQQSHCAKTCHQASFVLADGQQLLQLLKQNRPSWQSLPGSTAEQLLVRLVMLIERRTALPEVLPWLWPLADEDSGYKVTVKPSVQNRLLSALIAIPEAMDDALGGKVRLCACRICHMSKILWHN